jgi:hypothetical protein
MFRALKAGLFWKRADAAETVLEERGAISESAREGYLARHEC